MQMQDSAGLQIVEFFGTCVVGPCAGQYPEGRGIDIRERYAISSPVVAEDYSFSYLPLGRNILTMEAFCVSVLCTPP